MFYKLKEKMLKWHLLKNEVFDTQPMNRPKCYNKQQQLLDSLRLLDNTHENGEDRDKEDELEEQMVSSLDSHLVRKMEMEEN